MSEQSDIKETTKAELRAVLNSTPTCLPLSSLEADYLDLVGHPIPYRDMGYNTLEEFVTDIPDVITCWMSHGQMMTKAVAVKSTERITSLVARQKRHRTKASKGPASNKIPQQRSREKREPPKPVPQLNSSEYRILRGKVQGLLYAYKNGIKLSQFPEAFAKRFGQYFNLFDIGFSNVHELLESMTDVIDIEPSTPNDDFIVRSKVGPHTAVFQGLQTDSDFIVIVGSVSRVVYSVVRNNEVQYLSKSIVLLWSSPLRWIASTESPPPPRWQLMFSTVGV